MSTWSPGDHAQRGGQPAADAALARRGDQRQVARAGNREEQNDGRNEGAVISDAEHGKCLNEGSVESKRPGAAAPLPASSPSEASFGFSARLSRPDDAALGIEARNRSVVPRETPSTPAGSCRRFHPPAPCPSWPARHPPAAPAGACEPAIEVRQRGESPRADDVVAAPASVSTRACRPRRLGKPQLRRHLLHEGGLLGHRVEAGDLDSRGAGWRSPHPAARHRAHIQHARGTRPLATQRCDHGQAVQQMVRQHRRRIAQRGQVVDLVPLEDQYAVGQQRARIARSASARPSACCARAQGRLARLIRPCTRVAASAVARRTPGDRPSAGGSSAAKWPPA